VAALIVTELYGAPENYHAADPSSRACYITIEWDACAVLMQSLD